MRDEVILTKADGEFFAAIPHLGILQRAARADEAYDLALIKKREVEAAFQAAGASHLLEYKSAPQLEVRVWSQRLKKWVATSLALYFVGLIGLGLVIKKSIGRAADSVRFSVIDPDPKRIHKNVEKFRVLLEKYQPFIDEWEKATDKKNK